ncbi:hypothetical protein BOTCAL_0165g00010 [Botryotinia calthae]|uniref:DUF6546 domain-containing protein n=1 Tax=Botryotinia calthae TaxID=38488 RepID=A0A4Y8D212_9HELO|nr:hypothetical protein BOTCAL_0165g00010 [Botryotinia calthae]
MSLMTADMISWEGFPLEIRLAVLKELMQDGCSLADFATVSREWQKIIEAHNFSRIKLTSARLADFGQMLHRNRSLVRYIWLCLELQEYDCTGCDSQDPESWCLSYIENTLITTGILNLFTTLSVWEPGSSLLLEISVYSPSDLEHWFKYLTFEPDDAFDMFDRNQHTKTSMLVRPTDHHHGWIAGSRNSIPSYIAIEKVFADIFGETPFDNEEQETQWWQQLPLVPVITGILFRQQNRRRWRPTTLRHMFALLPRLQEIHYEPWREWFDAQQKWIDPNFQLLFESLSCAQLQRLIIFENFDQTYPASYRTDCDPMRILSSSISRALANASLKLEHLSLSFMVEASHFFKARELSWKWPNLTWLALTSRLLIPQELPAELDDMLQAAAAAAMNMPNLEIMEIWNGKKGLAMLFRYQRGKQGRPAVITCKGTWELNLRPLVIQAWDSVSWKHCGEGIVIIKELLDISDDIKSHGDAIHYLELSKPVVRPVSLRQIQMKHTIYK